MSGSDVCRRQSLIYNVNRRLTLTSKVDPRNARLKINLMAEVP